MPSSRWPTENVFNGFLESFPSFLKFIIYICNFSFIQFTSQLKPPPSSPPDPVLTPSFPLSHPAPSPQKEGALLPYQQATDYQVSSGPPASSSFVAWQGCTASDGGACTRVHVISKSY